MNSIIQFKNVTKEYDIGAKKLLAVDKISFSIKEGEFVVILGPSGAGKSTVLNLLGGMDTSTSGEIYVKGVNITEYNETQLTQFRAENVGFVFQFYNLIPTLTTLENVSLIKNIVKAPFDAIEVLNSVGLGDHLSKFPSQLSGGEQQRVSLARAVCKNPAMLLCDEPTGALDSETGVVILSLLQKMSREENKTVVIVTHNAALAETADRVIRMKNGKVTEIFSNKTPLAISEVNW